MTDLAYQPKWRERSVRPKKHVTFALSEQKSAYPVHTRELDEDEDDKPLVRPDRSAVSEDEDDTHLVQPASRDEPVKRESAAERRVLAQIRRRKGPPVWRDPSATLEQDVSGNSRERSEEVSILGKNSDGEALTEHHQQVVGRAQFEGSSPETLPHVFRAVQMTTHQDILGKVYNLYQHVVKKCPFCKSTKPKPDRSRMSALRAEEFGDLIFLDHGSTKIGNKTFKFLIILDGATSHSTAYPCKSTSPSELISKLSR